MQAIQPTPDGVHSCSNSLIPWPSRGGEGRSGTDYMRMREYSSNSEESAYPIYTDILY